MLDLFYDDKITWSNLRFFFSIQCKRLEHLALKELVNPHCHMVPTTHKCDKFVQKLQNFTRFKVTCNYKMCKDKWNKLNFDYKKIFDCHERVSPHTVYWELIIE